MTEEKLKLVLLVKKIKNWQWASECCMGLVGIFGDLGKQWRDSKRVGNDVAELSKNRQ